MLSNVFVRLWTSVRPVRNYQQHFLRLLSTTESAATEDTPADRQTGIVKRFSKDKGYGFISKNSDGTDCFVHFKNINTTGFKTLEQGQEVEFSIVQGEKGLEAKNVNILNPGKSRSYMGGSSYNNSTSSRFGGGAFRRSVFEFDGTKSSDLHSDVEDSSSTENLFSSRRTPMDQKYQIGSVKRWTIGRGFGFIRRTDGGPDLFCHARSLQNGLQSLDEGQTVRYRIQRTDKGEEARDVSIYNDEAEPSETSNERQTGTVRRWLPEKGYGFVRRDSGGSDVFVHLRDLNDGVMSLEEGQAVEFNLRATEKGDTAQNVTIRNEP